MKATELPQPEAFKGTLRPYQLRGLQWLAFLDRLEVGGQLVAPTHPPALACTGHLCLRRASAPASLSVL